MLLVVLVAVVLSRMLCIVQMIVEPEQRVADFAKAGADIISVHCEQSSTTHLDRVLNQVTIQVAKNIKAWNSMAQVKAIEGLCGDMFCIYCAD